MFKFYFVPHTSPRLLLNNLNDKLLFCIFCFHFPFRIFWWVATILRLDRRALSAFENNLQAFTQKYKSLSNENYFKHFNFQRKDSKYTKIYSIKKILRGLWVYLSCLAQKKSNWKAFPKKVLRSFLYFIWWSSAGKTFC